MSDQNQSPQGMDRQNALNDSKKIEFYSQGVAAWFNSALERDKSLLTLSVAGVGVLVSMMQMAIDSVGTLLLYIGALLAFMVCLFSVLMIFQQNKKHIEDVLSKQATDDPLLKFLDSSAMFSFLMAILLSAMLGISSAVTTYNGKGNKVANENQPTKLTPAAESFNHAANLTNSFLDTSQLQGQPQGQATQSTTTTSPSPSPSAQGGSSEATNK